jgi:hypothetical protein
MPRPSLPVGTWGKIRRKQYGPGRWQARARFRDYDGHTRDVEAWAATGAAAERHLLEMLRDRATPTGDDITRDTRISQLAERWSTRSATLAPKPSRSSSTAPSRAASPSP